MSTERRLIERPARKAALSVALDPAMRARLESARPSFASADGEVPSLGSVIRTLIGRGLDAVATTDTDQ